MSMDGPGPPRPPKPTIARIYDHWLGGKDNGAADREMADLLCDPERGGHTGLRVLARENRRFVLAAVQRLAGLNNITQYLDLGCGLPTRPAVHEVARHTIPLATVTYVDRAPLVVSHVDALSRGTLGISVIQGDIRKPAVILEEIQRRDLIDFTRPAAVLACSVLAFMDADTARMVCEEFTEPLTAGSALAVSVSEFQDRVLARRLSKMFSASSWQNHDAGTVSGWFRSAGLELARGKVGDLQYWPMFADGEPRESRMIGGLGFKR
jgi:hypothetical protein